MRGRHHVALVAGACVLAGGAWAATQMFWDEPDYRKPPVRTHVSPEQLDPTPEPTCGADKHFDPRGLCFEFPVVEGT
jgi:hypothetical protein